MTDVRSRPATLTLLVAHAGALAGSSAANLVADADEVIEISATEKSFLRQAAPAGAGFRHIKPRVGGLAHALNLGISFASSEWVAISFGDETVVRGWLNSLRSFLVVPNSQCIHLFHSKSGSDIPLVVARRTSFVYGSFDERFACGRLAALHWAFLIFPRAARRLLPDEGVCRHHCDFIENHLCPPVEAPLTGLVELWKELSPGIRSALLEQAIAAPDATRRSLSNLLDTVRKESTAQGNPYRSGAVYDAKRFWEANSIDYIRWETFQPDEPEIVALLRKTVPASVLELGCGAGRNTRYFAAAGRYAGIDLSMSLLRRAIERQEPNSHGMVCGDITALPFADATFDLVFSDSTLQHVTQDGIRRCVAEIVRVSAKYICVIEYTEEEDQDGEWFKQVHMFAHDYRRLFEPFCDLVWRTDTGMGVHPARKEVFLFTKR